MRLIQKLSAVVVVIVAIAWLFAMTNGTPAYAKGRPAPCPSIYAPVICDGGKIYPNQCEADKKHARNCVALGLDGE